VGQGLPSAGRLRSSRFGGSRLERRLILAELHVKSVNCSCISYVIRPGNHSSNLKQSPCRKSESESVVLNHERKKSCDSTSPKEAKQHVHELLVLEAFSVAPWAARFPSPSAPGRASLPLVPKPSSATREARKSIANQEVTIRPSRGGIRAGAGASGVPQPPVR
jgi:hypothetical protein